MRHVSGVTPDVRRRVAGHRGGGRPQLGAERERVGFQRQHSAIGADDLELVGNAFLDVGNEGFPHARAAAQAHGVSPPVPGVERAHHRHPPRVRGPHRELEPPRAFVVDPVRAHLVEQPCVTALGHQVVVERTQDRAEAVGPAAHHSSPWRSPPGVISNRTPLRERDTSPGTGRRASIIGRSPPERLPG